MANLRPVRRVLVSVSLSAALLLGASRGLLGTCGVFTDVAADAFCAFVLEVFYLGTTTGTTPTTFDPTANVSRLQMAAFLSRSVDGVLKRGSRRAAMKQFWTSKGPNVLGLTTVGGAPSACVADGADIWVSAGSQVKRVRASDGKLLETWIGFPGTVRDLLAAMGRVLTVSDPGNLYVIDPSQPPASGATLVASNLGAGPFGIAFDGTHVWSANLGTGTIGTGSVSIATPSSTIPWSTTTVTVGFSNPRAVFFDGSNVWAVEFQGPILKLDGSGVVLQTVTVGANPVEPVFDGANIWVPNSAGNSVSVVKASSGAVLQTLTGNGLNVPTQAAFDGERILVTDYAGNSVSLWKAADLTPLGFFLTGLNTNPIAACSDGINSWVALWNTGQLARF